jgi:hypothetical protein
LLRVALSVACFLLAQVTTKTLVGVFGFTEAEVGVYHQSLPEARRATQQATL